VDFLVVRSGVRVLAVAAPPLAGGALAGKGCRLRLNKAAVVSVCCGFAAFTLRSWLVVVAWRCGVQGGVRWASSLLAGCGSEGEGRRLCLFFFSMETGSSWFEI
jgi:hypothetical protein